MKYVRLGNSGLFITELTFGSALTIGTEIEDQETADSIIDKAWELGIRSFDVANFYGNGKAEVMLGRALAKYPRQEFVIATKCARPVGDSPYHKGLSRKHILWALDESLRRLGMDYVDLYYAHRYDETVPMSEIAGTFNDLIRRGVVRYWGTSEWPLQALQECHNLCDERFLEKPIVEQFIYSYAVQKSVTSGVKEFCDSHGMGTIGFSPLCQGYLTGKYKSGVPSSSRIAKQDSINYHKTSNFYSQYGERIDYFLETCEKFNCSPTATALLWCLRKKVFPVFGASSLVQLEENVLGLSKNIPDACWESLESFSNS